VVQDTGVGDALPTGDGVLLFGDADGAVAAIADLTDRYDGHCEASRAIAESHLSTDVVLPRLLDAVLA
jgi:hypothetical protein